MFEKWLRVTLVVALSLTVAGLAVVNADEPKKDEMTEVKADEKKADDKKADEKKAEAEKKPVTAAEKMEAARKAAIKSRDRIRSTNQNKSAGKGVRRGPQIPSRPLRSSPVKRRPSSSIRRFTISVRSRAAPMSCTTFSSPTSATARSKFCRSSRVAVAPKPASTIVS